MHPKTAQIMRDLDKPPFPVGTVVYLKSGSPPLTVTSYTSMLGPGVDVSVEWFAGSELRRDAFHKDSLTIQRPQDG